MMRIHIFHCVHGGSARPQMMQFKILSLPVLGMSNFKFCANKNIFFQCYLSGHHDEKWILCLQHMVFTLWLM